MTSAGIWFSSWRKWLQTHKLTVNTMKLRGELRNSVNIAKVLQTTPTLLKLLFDNVQGTCAHKHVHNRRDDSGLGLLMMVVAVLFCACLPVAQLLL